MKKKTERSVVKKKSGKSRKRREEKQCLKVLKRERERETWSCGFKK